METRANSLIVGLFALLAVAAVAVFTWWQSSGTGGETREVLFIFPGSVAGLTAGSSVSFNGIRIGSVAGVSLDVNDLRVVNVRARVQEDAPLKTDTRAILEFQGLTGYASIGLTGGSFTADRLFAQPGVPTIRGEQSTITQLLSEGESIAQRATSILDQVDTLISVNTREVNTTVSNAAVISRNLADASEDVATVLNAAGDVATSFQALSGQVGDLAGKVGETVGRIDVEEINAALGNVTTITGTLADNEEEIGRLITNFETASTQLTGVLGQVEVMATDARQAIGTARGVIAAVAPETVSSILANLDTATGLVADNGDDITRLTQNAGEATERLNAILGDASGIGAQVNAIVAAVDSTALGDVVANTRALTETLATSAEGVSRAVTSAETFANRAATALEGTEGLGERVNSIVSSVDATKINETLTAARDAATSAQATIANVDPEALGAAVSNVRTLTETLAGSADGVSRTLASAETVAARAAAALQGTEGLGAQVNSIVSSVDATKINETLTAARDAATSAQATIANVDPEALGAAVSNVRTLTETLAGSADGVSRTVASAETVAARAAAALEGTEGLGAEIDTLVSTLSDATTRVDTLLAGVAPESVTRITEGVASASESVTQLLTEAQGLPASFDAALLTARGAIREARGIFEAIDPEAVRGVVTDVETFSDTLAARAPDINATVQNLRTASEQANAVLGDASEFSTSFKSVSLSAERIVARVDSLLGDVEPNALGDTVNNVRDVTATLAENREGIGQALQDVSSMAARLQESANRVDSILISVQGLVDDDAEQLFTNASAAAASLRDLSTDLGTRIPQIASNLDQFTGRGLAGLTSLIEEGQRTVGSLDRVIGTVEADPQQFIFGREGNSDYQPRGRQ